MADKHKRYAVETATGARFTIEAKDIDAAYQKLVRDDGCTTVDGRTVYVGMIDHIIELKDDE